MRAAEHLMPDTVEIAVKPKLSAKDEVRALLDRLPDNVTLEDIAYHLEVVIKVLEAEADTSGGIPHEEAKRRFAQWFAK
jgi:hypothetical protein